MPSSPASEDDERAVEERAAREGPPRSEDGAEAQRDLRAELADMEDRYKRALADLENYRKRSAREVDRRVAESREALARDWLEAVDSVERALRMGSPGTPLFDGLRGVLEQMEATLARHGVTRTGSAGEVFDPERHEAVGVRPTNEVPDRTIVEVVRSGFALGDRVLRPAQVIVARREEPED
jgi:molecular chaperone GrpE